MRFRTKDLVITVLPRRTVIADQAECPEQTCPEQTCPDHSAGCTGYMSYTTFACTREPTPPTFNPEREMASLRRRLRALEAYQKAMTDEETEEDPQAMIDAINRDEARLEAALEGLREARRQLEPPKPGTA